MKKGSAIVSCMRYLHNYLPLQSPFSTFGRSMKLLLAIFFLLLCLFMFGGGGQLYGPAHISSFGDSSKVYERITQADPNAGQNNLPLINKSAVSTRDETFNIDVPEIREEEEDEHDEISSKRYRESDFFAAVFCALTRCYFSSCIRELLPFSHHFSDTPAPKRYLVLQVFRI